MAIGEFIQAREDYIELIKKELLGPGSEISLPDEEHELISDSPNTRYSMGILYPQGNKLNADNNDMSRVEPQDEELKIEEDTAGVEEISEEGFVKHLGTMGYADEENLDEEIGLAAQNMPSSMGITFFATGNSTVVNCILEFATYRKAVASDCRIPFEINDFSLPEELDTVVFIDKNENTLRLTMGGLTKSRVREIDDKDALGGDEHGIIALLYKLSDQLAKGYVREPHKIDVSLDFAQSDYIDQNAELDGTSAKVTALRRRVSGDTYSITVMLVNDDMSKSSAKNCIYQPKLTVSTENNDFILAEYSGVADFSMLNDEEKSLILQYTIIHI